MDARIKSGHDECVCIDQAPSSTLFSCRSLGPHPESLTQNEFSILRA